MNAAEVRQSLEPFKNFAPAILCAASIIEAAEAAEKTLASNDSRKQQLTADVTALTDQVTRLRQSINTLQGEQTQAISQRDAARAEVVGAQAELAEARKQRDTINAEIAALKSRLDVPVS